MALPATADHAPEEEREDEAENKPKANDHRAFMSGGHRLASQLLRAERGK